MCRKICRRKVFLLDFWSRCESSGCFCFSSSQTENKCKHPEAHPAPLNLLHPLDYHSVSTRGFCKVCRLFGEADFQCDTGAEAHFGKGTKLTVLEKGKTPTPPKVTVFPPSPKECRGKKGEKKKTIVCVAKDFYPDHVRVYWKINDENATTGVSTDSAAVRDEEFYKISSRLRVTAKEWHKPGSKFTCIVSFFDGENWIPKTESVYGEKDKAGEGLPPRDKYLKITQTAKLSYTVFIIKSCFYGAFVTFLLLRLQGGKGKN